MLGIQLYSAWQGCHTLTESYGIKYCSCVSIDVKKNNGNHNIKSPRPCRACTEMLGVKQVPDVDCGRKISNNEKRVDDSSRLELAQISFDPEPQTSGPDV